MRPDFGPCIPVSKQALSRQPWADDHTHLFGAGIVVEPGQTVFFGNRNLSVNRALRIRIDEQGHIRVSTSFVAPGAGPREELFVAEWGTWYFLQIAFIPWEGGLQHVRVEAEHVYQMLTEDQR